MIPHLPKEGRYQAPYRVRLSAILGALVRRAIRGSLRIHLPFIRGGAAGWMYATVVARVRDRWRSARNYRRIRIRFRAGGRIGARSLGIGTLSSAGVRIVSYGVRAWNIGRLVHEELMHTELDAGSRVQAGTTEDTEPRQPRERWLRSIASEWQRSRKGRRFRR